MKPQTKRYTLALTFMLLWLGSNAQTIKNVDFEQKDKKIEITWQLQGLETSDVADIKIYYRVGTNNYYSVPAGSISGHYGKLTINSVPYNGIIDCKATWDVLSSMEKLQGELDFKVTAVITKPSLNSFTDKRDGKTYKTVKIGNQIWMAENLAYKPSSGNYWAYENSSSNVEKYGYLYDWETAKKVCPSGWHLPSDNEWKQLENYLINNGYNYDGSTSGDKMAKSLASKNAWNSSPNEGTIGNNPQSNNKSCFTALPGGRRKDNGNLCCIGNYGYWWSATEFSANSACYWELHYYKKFLLGSNVHKDNGFSVRCLRD